MLHARDISLLRMMTTAAACLAAATASGQTYPNRPVRVVAAQAGGQSDFVVRLIAPFLSASLGQTLVVENRGGNPVIAIEAVVKAAPDGYSVLTYGSTLWLLPMLQTVGYDTFRDFVPLTLATRSPNILVVHPSVPAKSVVDLVALARRRPGELNYASTIVGSATHLAAELFKSLAGVNIVRVPYKGAGPALTDLIGGHVDVMFSAPGSVRGHVDAGRLRALGVTSAQPSAVLPGLPPIATSGLPGYESESMIAMFLPAGTPATIAARLNESTVSALQRPEVKERMLAAGLEAVGTTAAQLTDIMRSEVARMGKVIKAAGIRID